MTLLEKLQKIQFEMKAPKNLYNSFGKYKYRNAESILEAFKPFGEKYKVILVISDDIINVGDRYYIKSVATLYDSESKETIGNTSFAREDFDKKGMDSSQITGTASSYARKYALNGLFLLDDTKDADTDEFHKETEKKAEAQKLTDEQFDAICDLFDETSMPAMLKYFGVKEVGELTEEQAKKAITQRKKTLEGKKNE